MPPYLPFAITVGIGSVGWIPALRRDALGRQGCAENGRSIPGVAATRERADDFTHAHVSCRNDG
jgi:hypothetical protein